MTTLLAVLWRTLLISVIDFHFLRPSGDGGDSTPTEQAVVRVQQAARAVAEAVRISTATTAGLAPQLG